MTLEDKSDLFVVIWGYLKAALHTVASHEDGNSPCWTNN